MASVTITEYTGLGPVDNAGSSAPVLLPLPQQPPAVEQTAITLSGSSQASSAFGSTTTLIEVSADGAFRAKIGTSPTASANSTRRDAGLWYFDVAPGQKIAVINP